MLTIWTRARQNPGTYRRLASFHRHRLIGIPTSTFTYTILFTTGLAYDARAKAARNRQWEETFAHLRGELDRQLPEKRTEKSQPCDDQPNEYPTPIFRGNWPNDLDWDSVRQAVGMELSQDFSSQHSDVQSSWNDLFFDSRRPGAQRFQWPANTGRNVTPYNFPPQSLWSPDSMRLTAMRRRYTWKKLALKELATGHLIHKLIRRARLLEHFRYSNAIREDVSPQLLDIVSLTYLQAWQAQKDLRENIERLQDFDVNSSAEAIANAKKYVRQPGIPGYFEDGDGDFHGICDQMNAAIRQLFRTSDGDKKTQAIGILKICHNLLVSTAPPDVQTFNILLSGFKMWQRPTLVDDTVIAFYYHKIRPNEITCREILNHYTNESRPDDFSSFVSKMRGVGQTLMLANPGISVNKASMGQVFRVDGDTVFQKVHPTPMVFGALMDGVLKFAGFDRALDIYYEMKGDGWGLDLQGLTRLLQDCIRRNDWEGGTYLWAEINSLKENAKEQDMAEAYYHMLGLCSVAGKTVAFNQLLTELVRRGFNAQKILTSAKEIAEELSERDNIWPPPWTADNVMIAMSYPIRNVKPPRDDDEMQLVDSSDTDMSLDVPPFADVIGMQLEEPAGLIDQPRAETGDSWAKWVKHELGLFRKRS